MKAISDAVAAELPFARVEFQTVRDDAAGLSCRP
jgi:hypothetical protein